MSSKKTLTYGRLALVVFLVIYLIVAWMYFKDNTLQLTSSSLLLWFIVIPLVLFGFIILINWWQKKITRNGIEQPPISSKQEKPKQPDSYPLFIYSSICLPEGESWSEIINNDEDLTLLSTELSDFDGLPVLIKPISRVVTESYDDNHTEEQADSIDDSTLRLATLISEQLSLSEEALSVLAQHFNTVQQQNIYEPNLAIHSHPEWQQQHIISANDDSEFAPSKIDSAALITLEVYLCLPDVTNSALLVKVLQQQLASYEIPDSVFTITTIISDHTHSNSHHSTIGSKTYQPSQFIDEHLISLSKASAPTVYLLIAVDSQINEAWIASSLYAETRSNVIPTEAGTFLMFYNETAQSILDTYDLKNSVRFSLTKIGDVVQNSGADATDSGSDRDVRANNKNYYTTHLNSIKQLLFDNSFVLPSSDIESHMTKKKSTSIEKRQLESSDKHSTVINRMSENEFFILSDINPSYQPYDLSVFMTFIDKFIAQESIVNDYNLGHYMPKNSWMKPFLGLALFVDLASNSKQELDIKFFITQHKRCCMLWLADFPQAS